MSKKADLTGQRFGRLVVIEEAPRKKYGKIFRAMWRCKCDCGNIKDILESNLKRGTTRSCGCLQAERIVDLVNQKFGRLLVLEKAGVNKNGFVVWLCKCDCGKTIIVDTSSLKKGRTKSCGCIITEIYTSLIGSRFGRLVVISVLEVGLYGTSLLCQCDCGNTCKVIGSNLKRGNTKSCGCLAKELQSIRSTKHGHLSDKIRSRTYRSWEGIKRRCYKTSDSCYMSYGGRGITVCSRWRESFIDFLEDMGECPEGMTIDRIDNDGNYEPGNCKWSTPVEQCNNRRNSKYIEYNGKIKTVAQWARFLDISESALRRRIFKSGWSIERAFTTPIRPINKKT